ncbi:alpha-L-rhamnosidase-like isoform X1 [Sycon ciliatum]|uniref:alpha-L-rhamnosidase-like isoform X1 n=1 Tax=Sycon ciliatum TaxID=27933 RepID=UPI0031F6E5F1
MFARIATLLCAAVACATAASNCPVGHDADCAPYDLRCQHLSGVPAIDVRKPVFTWKIPVIGRGVSQESYRVVVSADRAVVAATSLETGKAFEKDSRVLWDSGLVSSSENYNVIYDGQDLQSRTTYYWKVQWSGQDGAMSGESDIAAFHVALLSQADWLDASWIAAPLAKTAPLLTTTMSVPVGLAESHLYVSGLGWCRVSVNGADVTPFELGPGWTTYNKKVTYSAINVTQQLQGAKAATIAVTLGLGWRDAVFASKDGKFPDDKYPRVLRMQVSMKHANGLTLVGTDESWTWQETPIIYDSMYNGETYNASLKDLPQPLRNASMVTGPAGDMIVSQIPQILTNRTVKPVNISQPQENVWVVDFGENLSGRVKVSIKNAYSYVNVPVTFHYAEILMHEPYGSPIGLPYFGNLRGAKATDTYIINGKDENPEVYEPSFTYHGFRYVQITGWPGLVNEDDITMNHFFTSLKRSGTFNTSSKTMNAIQRNVWSGQESNAMSVLTDCDQRDERLGWMGDAGLSSDSYSLNFDMSAFFPNMLRNIEIEQGDDGSIPDVVPFVRYGGRPADPSWSAAYPQIAWCMMHYYGDTTVATKHASGLMKYVQEMMGRSPEDFTKYPGSYGDWCPPPPNKRVATAVPSAFSFTNNLRQIAEIAKANATAVAFLTNTSNEYVQRFEKAFLSTGGHYLNDMQVSYALGMALDKQFTSSPQAANFVKAIHAAKEHLTTGIIGSKFTLPVLSKMNEGDLALQIVEQTDYPSWGWMVFNDIEPATAIWELWDAWKEGPGMNSRNHHMFSSVSGWMRTHAVGFHITEPGMKKLRFEPAKLTGLSWAQVSHDEPRRVEFNWQRHGGTHCAKSAEGPSPINNKLPQSDPMHVTCGEHGGVITSVDFASFGKPSGRCGHFEQDETCHSNNSLKLAEQQCIGKSVCMLPIGADYWGNPCGGVKRLYIQVTCSKPHTVTTDITVPAGSEGLLSMPAYGTEGTVLYESGNLLWENDRMSSSDLPGIRDMQWDMENDALAVQVLSGKYRFVLTGVAPSHPAMTHTAIENDDVLLECPAGHRITQILRATFGHAGHDDECNVKTAHRTVKTQCYMKQHCRLQASSSMFGSGCTRTGSRRQLHVEAQCSKRHA